MNPALSVIFFTTASGAGYGALVWLGVLTAGGRLPATPWFGVPALVIALALVTAGLLSSTLHLGHPERAWRAFSQWRSSWLSREGAASLVTYIPAGLFGLIWLVAGRPVTASIVFGLLAALMAVLTVVCTAMIYVSLPPIRQWHNGRVVPLYLLCALFTGATVLAAITVFWNAAEARLPAAIGILFDLAALVVTLGYWRFVDTAPAVSTAESATGLGAIGKVRMLEAPHTEENYLLREMGFAIARKHAIRLRAIALTAGHVLPALLLIAAIFAPGVARVALLIAAAALSLFGVLLGRWLFFAQATHTVTLYYGRAA